MTGYTTTVRIPGYIRRGPEQNTFMRPGSMSGVMGYRDLRDWQFIAVQNQYVKSGANGNA